MSSDKIELASQSATALTTRNNYANSTLPRSLDEMERICNLIVQSDLCPPHVKTPADAFVILSMGADLGLSPVQALRGIVAIQGKPFVSADVTVGAVLRSGLADFFEPVSVTNESATFTTRRKGSPTVHTKTFSMRDAANEGLAGKDNWKRMPSAMLAARAKARLAREVYPDVTSGLYDPSEADSFEVEMVRLEPRESQPTPPANPIAARRASVAKPAAPVRDVEYEAAPADTPQSPEIPATAEVQPDPKKELTTSKSVELARKYVEKEGVLLSDVMDFMRVTDLFTHREKVGHEQFTSDIKAAVKAVKEMVEQ